MQLNIQKKLVIVLKVPKQIFSSNNETDRFSCYTVNLSSNNTLMKKNHNINPLIRMSVCLFKSVCLYQLVYYGLIL